MYSVATVLLCYIVDPEQVSCDSFDTKYLSAAVIALKLVLMYSISSITVDINNLVNVSEDGKYNSQPSHLSFVKNITFRSPCTQH